MKFKNKKFIIEISNKKKSFENFTGYALPFNTICDNSFYPIVFEAGGEYTYQSNPTPVLLSHETTKAIGTANIEQSETGLTASLNIEDSEVTSRIISGALSGLSIGVIVRDGYDVANEGGGYFVVTKAEIVELSVTPTPAFTDARINESGATVGNARQKTVNNSPIEDIEDTSPEPEVVEDVQDEELQALTLKLKAIQKENNKMLNKQKKQELKAKLNQQLEAEKQKQQALKIKQNNQTLNQMNTYMTSSNQPNDLSINLVNKLKYQYQNGRYNAFNVGLLNKIKDDKYNNNLKQNFSLASSVATTKEVMGDAPKIPIPETFVNFPIETGWEQNIKYTRMLTNEAFQVVEEGKEKPTTDILFEERLIKKVTIASKITISKQLLQNPNELYKQVINNLLVGLSKKIDKSIMLEQDMGVDREWKYKTGYILGDAETQNQYLSNDVNNSLMGKGLLRSIDLFNLKDLNKSRLVNDILEAKSLMIEEGYNPNNIMMNTKTIADYFFDSFNQNSFNSQKTQILDTGNYSNILALNIINNNFMTNHLATVKQGSNTSRSYLDFPFIYDSEQLGYIAIAEDVDFSIMPFQNTGFQGGQIIHGFNGDDLIKNQITIVAEITLAFVLKNPNAGMLLLYGEPYSFNDVIKGLYDENEFFSQERRKRAYEKQYEKNLQIQ